jgi:hypothetical protein
LGRDRHVTIVCLAAGGIARASVNEDPSRVRSLSLVTMSGRSDPLVAVKHAEFEFLAILLMQADEMRENGKISPVEYEAA